MGRQKQRHRGKRGRRPTPVDVLKRRGSAQIRKKQSAELLIPKVAAGRPPPIPRTAGQWVALLKSLPAYDPFKDAGDCWFDRQAARAAILFFHNELRHFKGEVAGQPFYLERWQMAIVANLFGWKRADGCRRYRVLCLLCGRKNGKTPLAAGIILYLLFEDREAGAEIYSAGREYKQASKAFEYARGMLIQNEDLMSRCRIYGTSAAAQNRCVELPPATGSSFFRPIASDPDAAYCFNTHAYVIDELFTQNDRRLVEALETSTANRRQPLGLYLSTADFDRDSICNEKHDYARSVRDEGGDPYFLPVIFEALKDDDIQDRSTWQKANPNLGVSVAEEYLRREARRASRDPAYRATFKRVHLCIRTSAALPGIPADGWARCARVEVDPVKLKGRECWGGLDLASTSHSNALVLLFPEAKGAYSALAWFWLPERTVAEWEQRGKSRYRVWAGRGILRVIPGDTTDYGVIRRDLRIIGETHRIRELAVDRLYQGAQLCTDLQADGFEVIAFGQGFLSMAAPTKQFRELVLAGKMWHGNNPCLNWHAGNCSVLADPAGNLKPNRLKLHAPIDGIVSCIMALGRAMLRAQDAGPPRVRVI